MSEPGNSKVLALSGGVGGAKLALGLSDILPPGNLDVLVNTGDDFQHLGLHISPDIDTLLYTLSGLSDPDRGWGLAGETWNALAALQDLGAQTWFQLGDRDLATHLWRTGQLASGSDLIDVTGALARAMGIATGIHPMCADAVATTVHCGEQSLPFQHYFVREQCAPAVTGFTFEGIAQATPNPAVMAKLSGEEYDAIVICPSNPFVSIDPILQIPGLWPALATANAPVALVSPIVAGMALKGPAAKMMAELGVPVTAVGVAEHYKRHYPGLVKYFVIDASDGKLAPQVEACGFESLVTATIMQSKADKQQLARAVLEGMVD